MKRIPEILIAGLFLCLASLSAQPVDNPVATQYSDGYPAWTDQIAWSNVLDVTTDARLSGQVIVADSPSSGADNFAAFEAARDVLYGEGGGVLFFPAGTYYFELPDAGYGSGIGPNSRGLMLKKGVVIRGDTLTGSNAIIRNPEEQLDVTYDLEPSTVFVFPFQKRGTVPANATGVDGEPAGTANAAGETPTDWNFIGMTPGANETGVSEVDNVGLMNVTLVGGTVVFGFDTEWAAFMGDTGVKWEGNMFKADWPAGSAVSSEDWINRTPNGEHYMDLINGRTGWTKFVESGSGRLVMNIKIVDGAPWNDMIYVDRKAAASTVVPEESFAHYRYAGRVIAYGSNVFVANNVLAKPTKNFVHVQTQILEQEAGDPIGDKTVLFDYANHIGIDVNKSLLGGNNAHSSVHVIDGDGYYASNIVIKDNWVFNRGDKGFEVAGRHVVVTGNHNQRYVAANSFPYEYITNPEAYPAAVEGGDIDAGGISFDGYRWQSSESSSDYLSRGFDLGGMDVWVDDCTVINTGSRGNDGEAILGQRHNNVEVCSWSVTNSKFGPYTIDDTLSSSLGANAGYIGPYDMHSMGLFLMHNAGAGQVGMLKPASNYMLDGTWADNAATQATPATDHSDDWIAPGKAVEPHTDAVNEPVLSAVVNAAGTGVELSWVDNATNELGFRVERRVNGGDWNIISYRPRASENGVAAYPDATIASAVGQFDVGDIVHTQWTDYLAPLSETLDYRVVAINANDDLSTGISNVETIGEVPFDGLFIPFDDYTVGQLNGQDGWVVDAADASKVIVAGMGLDYVSPDQAILDAGNQHLTLSGSSLSKMNTFAARPIDPAPTGSTYLRVLMYSSSRGTSADPGELFVRLAGWNLYVAAKYYAGTIELPGGNTLEVDTTNGLPLNKTHMVLLKLNAEAGVVTGVDLWLNPEFADSTSPDLSVSGLSVDLSSVSNLEMRSQNTLIRVDEVALAETWGELVPQNADPFESLASSFDDLTVGEISGQGDWTVDAADSAKANVADGALTYFAPDSAELDGGTQHLVLSGSADARMNNWLTLPVDPQPDQTTYFRALVRSSDVGVPGLPGELFIRLAGWNLYLGAKFADGVVELPGPTTLEVDTVNGLPLDFTHMLLLRMNVFGGSVTSLDFWLNPAFADESSPDLSVNQLDVPLSSISQIELRSQNTTTLVDEILLAESWEEVVPQSTEPLAPIVLLDPTSASVEVGDSVQLSIYATGTPTLTYQWRKDGTDIDGATGSSYTIAEAALTDAGSYDVVVTNAQGSATSAPAVVEVSEPVFIPVVTLFEETFDSGETAETAAAVLLADLGWNVHHSFAGVALEGLLVDPDNADETKQTLTFTTTTQPGDFELGEAYGYQAFFINNYPAYGEGVEGDRPALPGPHPVTGQYYHNRTLATFLWKEAGISAADRATITHFNFVQGNRDASMHNFFPAVQIDGQWYVYIVDQVTLGDDVRILGRPGQNDPNGAETVFSGSQFSEGGAYANYYNAQPYSFAWSETGWTELVFDGGAGTDSTVGMTLGDPVAGELPMSAITAVGVYSPENIDPGYNFNGLRIDSIEILGEAKQEDLFTFTFNNEGTVNGLDRPIQAANWDGLYSSTAQPLVTGEAVFADLSEGVSDDMTPGSYKAGFLFVSGKNDQPAPEGFLVYSTNNNVVDEPQIPQGVAETVNPQTDWYSDPTNSVTNLNQLLARDLGELQMRINPRSTAIRYHFALQIGGEWYVSEQAFQHTGSGSWESVSLDAGSANWLSGVVGEGSINFDFTAVAPTVTALSDLPSDATLDTVGIYIDTDDAVGTGTTWARVDSITLRSVVPNLQGPAITEQPASIAVTTGGTAEFTVGVEVADGVTYQWRKDGVDLSGATAATLTLSGVTEADEGDYDVVVTNPGGSATSQAATLTVYALPTLDKTVFDVDSGSQALQIILTAEATDVTWSPAEAQDDWITITYAGSGLGSDLILFGVVENPDYSSRSGTLSVAGQTVTVNQEGKPAPATFEEAVGATDNGDGTFTSAWFGTFTSPGMDWIVHEEAGFLQVGAVALPTDMFMYSFSLESWVWTNEAAFPIMYEYATGEWIYTVVVGQAVYVYSYDTDSWSY